MDISRPFETFQKSAFRLEALPQYLVKNEEESFDSFKRTGQITLDKSSWKSDIENWVKSGKKIERLRLLSKHLTDYERYEIQAYSGPKSGEVIKTAPREDHGSNYQYDFWFFDEEWIAQVNYEDDGTFINFDVRRATDQEVEMYRHWYSVFQDARPLKQVPFVSNTPDDTHCLQAAYMSIAQYFEPTFAIPMEEWATLTGYEEGFGTWANAGLVWFKEHGYKVKHFESFNFEAFMANPKAYMIELNGKEAGEWGYEHTNIPAEQERIKQLLEADITEQREPNLEDIKKGLDEGYLARVTLNCRRLDGEQGYIGHAVTITDYNDEFVQFHDPGLPAFPNRQVTHAAFEAAWSDQARELDLIRKTLATRLAQGISG